MEKTTWDYICDTFDDLDNNQFKKFTDKLVDSPFEPRFRRKDVEGKDRSDVARHLIDKYTEENAVKNTVQILKLIDCNKAAKDLEANTNGSSSTANVSATGSSSTANVSATGSSSTAKVSATAVLGAAFIDNNRVALIQRTTGLESILDSLLEKNIINNEQYSKIQAKETDQQMMRALLMGPMKATGNKGKNALYEILMEEQTCMMQDLGAK